MKHLFYRLFLGIFLFFSFFIFSSLLSPKVFADVTVRVYAPDVPPLPSPGDNLSVLVKVTNNYNARVTVMVSVTVVPGNYIADPDTQTYSVSLAAGRYDERPLTFGVISDVCQTGTFNFTATARAVVPPNEWSDSEERQVSEGIGARMYVTAYEPDGTTPANGSTIRVCNEGGTSCETQTLGANTATGTFSHRNCNYSQVISAWRGNYSASKTIPNCGTGVGRFDCICNGQNSFASITLSYIVTPTPTPPPGTPTPTPTGTLTPTPTPGAGSVTLDPSCPSGTPTLTASWGLAAGTGYNVYIRKGTTDCQISTVQTGGPNTYTGTVTCGNGGTITIENMNTFDLYGDNQATIERDLNNTILCAGGGTLTPTPTPPGYQACFECGFEFRPGNNFCASGNIVWEGWMSNPDPVNECYGRLAAAAGNLLSCRGDYDCIVTAGKRQHCGGEGVFSAAPNQGVGWSTCRRPEVTGQILMNPNPDCSGGSVPPEGSPEAPGIRGTIKNSLKLCRQGTNCQGNNRLDEEGCQVRYMWGSAFYSCYLKRGLVNPAGSPGESLGITAEVRLDPFDFGGQRYTSVCPASGWYSDLGLRRNDRYDSGSGDPSLAYAPGVIRNRDFKIRVFTPTSLSGRVYDDPSRNCTGKTGVNNAAVTVNCPSRSTITGPDGHYDFSNLTAGLCFINATKPNYDLSDCVAQSINLTAGANTKDLYLSPPGPWFQGKGGDARKDYGFVDPVPLGNYALLDGNGGTPGVIFTGDASSDFSPGSSSSKDWVAGGITYPESFTPVRSGVMRTSYDYYNSLLQQNGITPSDLAKTCNLDNCTLPGGRVGLANGIYKAGGDVSLNAYTFPSGKNYVILIDGNLTLKGNIIVPIGSTVTFSVSGSISVDRNLGEVRAASTDPNLEGFYSADQSFIIQGHNNCGLGADRRLNIAGAVFVNVKQNRGRFAGSLQNNRDLCADNPYPSLFISERPDFILNAPAFTKHPNFIWQEVAP